MRSFLAISEPELSDSIGSQESISYIIKEEKTMLAISTQWVKTYLVIPAFAGMTAAMKSTKKRSI